MNRSDIFISLPTGFGKSLIFQGTPLCFDYINEKTGKFCDQNIKSLAIVIVPLKSLALDQVKRAELLGIEAAAMVSDSNDVMDRVCEGRYSLLFASPEVLLSSKGKELMMGTHVYHRLCCLFVDESHCIVKCQLLHDGYHESAQLLSKVIQPVPDCPPSNRLQKVVQLGLRAEPNRKPLTQYSDTVAPASGIDLDFDTEVQTNEPEAAMYETCYVTSHKGACRAAAWSSDGQLIATASADASIKVLDVERMLAKSATPAAIQAMENQQQSVESHPVIRTLYDHTDEVTAVEFHPTSPILVSGSKDYTVKFFQFSKSTVKKAFRIIHEVEKVKCLALHPTGDYILIGTKHPTLRLYDVNSLQCFVSSNPQDQHKGSILSVKYSKTGNMYATGSKDGDIKLWDGVSNRCINTFYKAHGGEPVCSVQFSKNGKYILSSGKDSLVKLWELSTSRTLITYTGAGSDKQKHRNNPVFNHTEDYVLFPDEKTTSLCCWDSRNAERNKLLSLGHNGVVRFILHSPTGPGLLTCSDDFRARFWYYRGGD